LDEKITAAVELNHQCYQIEQEKSTENHLKLGWLTCTPGSGNTLKVKIKNVERSIINF